MFDDLVEVFKEVPDISGYYDAFEIGPDGDYIPLFRLGDEIFFERWSTMLPTRRWLSTSRYTVKKIEHGRLWLYNEELHSWELTDFARGISEHGFKYKLTKRIKKPSGVTSVSVSPADPGMKKRGRPKGSKNKSKRRS